MAEELEETKAKLAKARRVRSGRGCGQSLPLPPPAADALCVAPRPVTILSALLTNSPPNASEMALPERLKVVVRRLPPNLPVSKGVVGLTSKSRRL
mgnify:CR=1 FL=1